MTDKSNQHADSLNHLTLGKSVEYATTYQPELLQAVPRSMSRDQIGLTDDTLPFFGVDVWNGYELSWLTPKGKPQVALLRCDVPYDSPNLIESKSFKLYLNSFNQYKLDSVDALTALLKKDLSSCAGKDVNVEVITPDKFNQLNMHDLAGHCIDDLDVMIDDYDLKDDHLALREPKHSEEEAQVTETLTSNLLKSNCLITNQPDWASIQIRYRGKPICHHGLLKYLISFRMHNEFHEQCAERIFIDIMKACQPEELTVYARYTRRGGLDINPLRSNIEFTVDNTRQARQ